MPQTLKPKNNRGISLVEAIVGIALMLIVFLGIFGAYQLTFKIINQSKSRITATAIANKQVEMAKNLPYQSVGVQGRFPDGILDASTTTIRNNIQFTIENRVDYVVDTSDGVAYPEDECPNDYKRVEIAVSWTSGFGGKVSLTTDISPQNIAQECSTGGGILSVSVFNAQGIMIESPSIEIKNPLTGEVVKSATPASGQHYFSLATSTYKIEVSKNGYSRQETYASGDNYNGKTIITPEKPNLTVLEGQLTEGGFSIDRTGSFSVDTLSPWGTDFFSDSFLNESKISEKSDVTVANGEIGLATTTEGYVPAGYLDSIAISPANLTSWNEFSFTDGEPTDTALKYQIYYASSTGWYLIPDVDLPENSTGFNFSPVNLLSLSATDYPQLKLRSNLSTASTTATPILYGWQISWLTGDVTAIPDAAFDLRGNKIVGTDADGDPIYKYSASLTSDSSGHKNIADLEWDLYTFSINPASGLDLIAIQPPAQPIDLQPNANEAVALYLDSNNSLLLTIQDIVTLEPIFAAAIRAYNSGAGYDKVQYTNEKGQTYFIPLATAAYNLEISAPGYAATSTSVWVSEDAIKTVKLEQIE